MKTDEDSSFDLIALARRGDLSDADERRLRDLLASSSAAKGLYEAGIAFDHEAPVLPGDDELVAKIELAVQTRLHPPKTPFTRRLIVRACLAAALITTSAIGASVLTKKSTPPVDVGPPIPTATAVPAATAPQTAIAPMPTEAPPSPLEVPSAIVRPKQPIPIPVPTQPQSSPAELFAAASRARVDGDRPEAIRLSRQLITDYPSSREAVSTHLSLGMLYLHDGQATPALGEFRSARSLGAPATRAEAVWGESQALRRLGRDAEERAALEELLTSHPDSAYAGAARKRVAELR